MTLLKIFSIILTVIGLSGLLVGYLRVRKLIALTRVERSLWRLLNIFICFFILGYLIYIPHIVTHELPVMMVTIGFIFCFGGVFVALVTALSVKTINELRNLERFRIQNRELRFKAEHDDLTQLYKRNFFNQSVRFACDIAVHGDIKSSVLFIDFDKFKHINDNYGHQVGDQVLKKTTELFTSYFRKDDIVARLGGDEFAVLLINTNYSDAEGMSRKLIKKISEFQITVADIIIKPSVSIGIAEISKECSDPEVIISKADQACYTQKKLKNDRKNLTDSASDFLASQ